MGTMNGLEKVQLGMSNLDITRVGIGTAPIGSDPNWHVYWGPQDEQTAINAIRKALDMGVNWIDTAPFYGWGRAEAIVGKAIQGRRDQVYIFTKCGTLPDGKGGDIEDNSAPTIKREIGESLRRLQTGHVDLLQIHDPDPRIPIEESWKAVHELVREGKVRYAGLSNHPADLAKRAMRIGPVVSNQLEYNPLERKIEKELLPFCRSNGIGVLGWGSLAEGFLTDNFDLDKLDPNDFRRRHKYSQPENFSRIMKVRNAFSRIAATHGGTMVDTVISWELAQPGITGAIIGIRSEKEAEHMVGGLNLRVSREELDAIDTSMQNTE